jgi:hypothetical protein
LLIRQMVLAPAFPDSSFHTLDRREKTLAGQVLGEGSNYQPRSFTKTKGLPPGSITNQEKISSRKTRFSSQCSLPLARLGRAIRRHYRGRTAGLHQP